MSLKSLVYKLLIICMGKIFSEASHASFSSTSPLEVIEKCVMNSTKSIVPLPSSSRILKTLNLVYNFPNSLTELSNFTRKPLLYQIGNWPKLPMQLCQTCLLQGMDFVPICYMSYLILQSREPIQPKYFSKDDKITLIGCYTLFDQYN